MCPRKPARAPRPSLAGELHRRLDFVVRRLEHEFVLAPSLLGIAGVEP